MAANATMRGAAGAVLVAVTAACGSAHVRVTGDKTSEHLGVNPTTKAAVVGRCPNTGGTRPYTSLAIPGTVQLPDSVTLPAGASVYGTDMPDLAGSHAYYVIGPAGKTCAAYTGSSLGSGIDVEPQGSGRGVHVVYRAGGQTNVADFACPYIPQVIPAGGLSTCPMTPAPGQVTASVPVHTPNTYVTVVRIPPGVSKLGVAWTNTPEAERAASVFPTVAVFAAHITSDQGERMVYAPEISCTLPRAQASTCSAALNYFLAQLATKEQMAPAELAETVHAVDQFIA
ncbi:MAG: hypothetical protein JWL97_3457 [Gemmatimonadales bacterium]|nr:hypothetical protein [Gemmatimonadales bacterium]